MKEILIIEDEPIISDLLISMVKKLRPNWKILTVLESVEESIFWLKTNPSPDLIFLDIQLNDDICFTIFDEVIVDSKIIFTTAYDNYAIQAFDLNSIHYLLKPIREYKLVHAIEKFESSIMGSTLDEKKIYSSILKAMNADQRSYRSKILIHGITSYYQVFIQDIAYFQIENKALYAITSDKKEHIIDSTIESLMPQLDPQLFFRVNRSTIVNIKFIFNFENYFSGKLILNLLPPFSKTFKISRLKANAFKIWMGQ